MATNFNVNLADLTKILEQIKIAEIHATTGALANLDGTPISALLPAGLRTVDGTYNNLLPGKTLFGAADQVMPRLLKPVFLNDADGDTMALAPPGSGAPTITNNNYSTHTSVADADPRIISNLISDQTLGNFSAVFKALQLAGSLDPMADAALIAAAVDPLAKAAQLGLDISANGSITIENLSPDIGLSPSFNGWMTLFGQFFDHGLDLIPKGGNGTVYIPLQPDDPLYVAGGPNFMALTRAATVTTAGADGLMGTADDQTHETINTTTPFIDQNQTYTSNASHQVFLREYKMTPTGPASTGHLLDGANGGIANWAEVKAQARSMLGIELNDFDVLNVPLLRTDPYGKFIPGTNGFAQIILGVGADGIANTADDIVVQGTPTTPVTTANALRTGHAFLDDIAHNAAPGFFDHDGNPATPRIQKTADLDTTVSTAGTVQPTGTYDNELLDRHYITGDGRGNENIGLTTVHTVFHAEHNRLVEANKQTILASGSLAVINEWLVTDLTTVAQIPTTAAGIAALNWDGERLFQAARFVTEMQYQHLVFEEFGRKVQPAINPFVFSASPDLNPAIVAEFAHVVYRFGHSMLTETVDRLNASNQVVDANPGAVGAQQMGLIQAFLNPVEFDQNGAVSASVAAGQIIRGMTRQVGNEIDEFVTEALRNNLVGLPLDLAALNIARGRDTGVPSFNEARAQFFAQTGDSRLTPYTSWTDFATHMKNPLSVVNFIAAYGTHSSILAATTNDARRDAAMLLVSGGIGAPADRVDYLNRTGTWAGIETGLNAVDFWIGGLAEEKQEFGGMLGATFNFVFESQMLNLQNGDRFYYLSRTQGMNLLNELEANSFTALVMRNTDLGQVGQGHLPGNLFDTPNRILEIVTAVQVGADPTNGNAVLDLIKPLFIRRDVDADGDSDLLQYNGGEHVVLGGSEESDTLIGGLGIDTLWGDGGNDRLDGGYEADKVHGGDGDDIITNLGGDDFLFGENGNDVISMGSGVVLGFGGAGKDFIMTGPNTQEVFGGEGDDFILGGAGNDPLLGNEGNDWIEGGEGFDGLSGENSELFFNSPIIGHDVLNGQGNDTDYDGESGDDIMVQTVGITRSNGMFGFDWGIHKGDPNGANSDLGIPFFPAQAVFTLRDRFDSVEGLSGWNHNDTLNGATLLRGVAGGAGAGPGNPVDESDLKSQNVSLINGFAELLGLTPAQVALMPFNTSVIDITRGAEVIIGGGGSDTIKGNLGNDYIDGDAWLNVRISVRNALNPALELFSVDSLNDIKARLLSGEINPGQLQIVREILQSTTAVTDVDTAVYNGNLSEYTIALDGLGTGNGTITHNVAGPLSDGVDRIRNIERLQFADQAIVIAGVNAVGTGNVVISSIAPVEDTPLSVSGTFADPNGVNLATVAYTWEAEVVPTQWVQMGVGTTFTPGDAAVGLPLRVKATFVDQLGVTETVYSAATSRVQNVNDVPVGVPVVSGIATQNQTLTANVAGIADADGLGAFTFQWSRGGTAIVGATNQTLVLTQADVGQTMAVRVNYTDLQGTPESLISASTTAVVNVNDPTAGSVTINNLTPDLLRTLTVSNNLTDPDGTLALVGYQWQSAPDGTNVWTDIVGATGNSFTTNTSGVQLRVAASYTVAGGPVEVMISSPVTAAVGVFHIILGTNAAGETLNGTAVADRMVALGGNDTMNGFDGNDILIGGAGTDTMAGGSGDDVYEVTEAGDMVIETLNQGNDSVRAHINYTLTDHVENLFLMGSAPNLTGTGNALDNVMSGNGGNNTLNGGSGTDAAVFSGVMAGYHLSYNLGVITVLDINAVDGSDGSDTLNGIEQLYFTGQSLAVGNFNALNYIASYSDLINAFGSNPDAGLAHYSSTGLNEGRSISFDPVTYLARYADLQTAFGTDVNAAARHFITNGFNEGRTSYVAGGITISGSPNADTLTGGTTSETLLGLDGDDTLTGGGGNDFLDGGAGNDIAVFKGVMKGYNGVVNDGNFTIVDKNLADGNDGNANFVGIEVLRFADRDLSLVGFNALDYVASYSDLIGAFGANAGAGFGHYLSYGVLEGRTISFDPITYLAKYNDLRIAFGTDSAAAARHYITYGFNEGRTSNTSGNDLLTGSASADTLNGGAGNDTILGLAGNDTLTGGIGVDNLTGGTDADNFNYNSVNESGIGAGNRDIITDFLSGTDRIDLSGIDANASLAGNQAFTMINTLAFSGVAGQLRYSAVGTDTVMEGDVDGNGVADFQIQLTGIHTFVPADLVL